MDKLSNKCTNRGGFRDLRREIGNPLKKVAVCVCVGGGDLGREIIGGTPPSNVGVAGDP